MKWDIIIKISIRILLRSSENQLNLNRKTWWEIEIKWYYFFSFKFIFFLKIIYFNFVTFLSFFFCRLRMLIEAWYWMLSFTVITIDVCGFLLFDIVWCWCFIQLLEFCLTLILILTFVVRFEFIFVFESFSLESTVEFLVLVFTLVVDCSDYYYIYYLILFNFNCASTSLYILRLEHAL